MDLDELESVIALERLEGGASLEDERLGHELLLDELEGTWLDVLEYP